MLTDSQAMKKRKTGFRKIWSCSPWNMVEQRRKFMPGSDFVWNKLETDCSTLNLVTWFALKWFLIFHSDLYFLSRFCFEWTNWKCEAWYWYTKRSVQVIIFCCTKWYYIFQWSEIFSIACLLTRLKIIFLYARGYGI